MSRVASKGAGVGLVLIALVWLARTAQVADSKIIQTLLAERMFLIDLRNDGYWITVPEERREWTVHPALQGDYLGSIVAPSGLSLFAVKRMYEGVFPRDLLVRRSLQASGGPEEVVSSSFKFIQQLAVSTNERFVVVGGRLKDADPSNEKRDGIFLLNRGNGSIEYIAPFPNAGLDESIHALNVGDRGDLVIYEESGDVVRLVGGEGRMASAGRQRGQLPALFPDGQAYIFADHGWLVWSDGKTSRDVLRVPKVVGGIRVSPDGRFVAFGTTFTGDTDNTRLRICDLESRTCVDGPEYSDWIAGRETFWIKR